MAIKIGITGEPNSGKSFSRTTIVNGEEVFVISPSAKAKHITTSDDQPLKRLNIATKDGKVASLEHARDILEAKETVKGIKTIHDTMDIFVNKKPEDLTITGNHITCRIDDVKNYLKFVDRFMPHIKTIIIPDFTHYVSAVLASESFIKRKAGGEAFQR